MKLSLIKKLIREEVKKVLHEDATNQTVVDVVTKATLNNFGPKVKARVLHFKDNMYTVGLRKGINGVYDPRYYTMLADDLKNDLPKEWMEQTSVDSVKIGTGGATEGSIILRLSPAGIKAVGKLARFGESTIKEAYPRSTPNTKLTLSLIKQHSPELWKLITSADYVERGSVGMVQGLGNKTISGVEVAGIPNSSFQFTVGCNTAMRKNVYTIAYECLVYAESGSRNSAKKQTGGKECWEKNLPETVKKVCDEILMNYKKSK